MTVWFLTFAVLSIVIVIVPSQKSEESMWYGDTPPSTSGFASYQPSNTISEVVSNPENWIGKWVRLKGTLERAVLEDDAVKGIMTVHLVDNTTLDAIYVASDYMNYPDRLFGRPVIVTGFCEKIQAASHWGTTRTCYFILPIEILQTDA